MSVELMIGALRRAQNGHELLTILDAITKDDSVADGGSFDYVESPMIEEVLGVAGGAA